MSSLLIIGIHEGLLLYVSIGHPETPSHHAIIYGRVILHWGGTLSACWTHVIIIVSSYHHVVVVILVQVILDLLLHAWPTWDCPLSDSARDFAEATVYSVLSHHCSVLSNLRIPSLKWVAIIPVSVTAQLGVRVHRVWHHTRHVQNSMGTCFESIVAAYLSVSRVVVLLSCIPWVSGIFIESLIVSVLSSTSSQHWSIWYARCALIIVELIACGTLWRNMIWKSSNHMVSRFSQLLLTNQRWLTMLEWRRHFLSRI